MSSVPENGRPTIERADRVPWSVATVKANLLAYLSLLHSSPTMCSTQGGGFVRWNCAVPHSWLNGVLVTRPPLADERPLLAGTLAYFRSAGVRAACWWVDLSVEAKSWEPHLRRQGWRPEWGTPAMMIDLTSASLPDDANSRLEIHEVVDEAGLRVWSQTMVNGFGLPRTWEEGTYNLIHGVGFGRQLRHWVGYLSGTPIGISSLFDGAGVAGLQYVATVPEGRGHGVGAAMACHALKVARSEGHTVGVLESSEMGYNLYLRLGFRTVGPLDYFYWER